MGILGQKGNTYVEKINFTTGESNYKIKLPTMKYLKVCEAKTGINTDDIVKLMAKNTELSLEDSLTQLQLMVPLANTSRIFNIECMEMFRMKLGGKNQDLNNSLLLKKFNWDEKPRLCATNEISEKFKQLCYNIATPNSMFCEKCEKNTKWLSRFTPPKLMVVWENKITKIPKPSIEAFEVNNLSKTIKKFKGLKNFFFILFSQNRRSRWSTQTGNCI